MTAEEAYKLAKEYNNNISISKLNELYARIKIFAMKGCYELCYKEYISTLTEQEKEYLKNKGYKLNQPGYISWNYEKSN